MKVEIDTYSCTRYGKALIWRDNHNSSLGHNGFGADIIFDLQILHFNLKSSHRPTPTVGPSNMDLCRHRTPSIPSIFFCAKTPCFRFSHFVSSWGLLPFRPIKLHQTSIKASPRARKYCICTDGSLIRTPSLPFIRDIPLVWMQKLLEVMCTSLLMQA
jgi:hypothetical protein